MIFSSLFFIFMFLPAVLIVYYLVPFPVKNLVLLLFSLVFYAWGEPVYVILMVLSILINFVSGLEMERFLEKGAQNSAKIACIVTVVVNLLMLGFYKYYGFLIDNINSLLHVQIMYKELSLPIGISFYTFQALSYVLDVYRGKVHAQHNVITFGCYVSMFPQLIAGPIVRYADVEKQLKERSTNLAKFGEGVVWFIQGLGKKVLLANSAGSIFTTVQALGSTNTAVLTAWIGCAAYTMQIYFDFSGYSDMAVGLGKMLGFDFVRNFNYPYTADSITEFWRRWHISLSSWFREYVYIPLGGNRVSLMKNIRNILIVWALTGLWHGATWNFIFWGLYYGVILILEKYVFANVLKILPRFLRHIYTMILVMVGWMLFAADSLREAITYLGVMVGLGGLGFADAGTLYFLKSSVLLLVIAGFCSTPFVFKRFLKLVYHGKRKPRQRLAVAVYILILFLSTVYLVNATYNPFLYFRF